MEHQRRQVPGAPPDPLNHPPGFFSMSAGRNVRVYLVLGFVTFAQAWYEASLFVISPAIIRDFKMKCSPYALALLWQLSVVLQPIASELSWKTGRTSVLLFGIFSFIFGNIMCFAFRTPHLRQFLGGLFFQAVGCALCDPAKSLICYDISPGARQIMLWRCFFYLPWALGTMVGSWVGEKYVLSSDETPTYSLRLLNTILVVAFLSFWFALQYHDVPRTHYRFDGIGTLVLTIFCSTVVVVPMALISGSWESIVGLTFGANLFRSLAALDAAPWRWTSVLKDFSVMGLLLSSVILEALMWITSYFVPLFYMHIEGIQTFKIGFLGVLSTWTTGLATSFLGLELFGGKNVKARLTMGWGFFLTTFLAMFHLSHGFSGALVFYVGLNFGCCSAFVTAHTVAGILSSVNKEDLGHAMCLIDMTKPIGRALGIGFSMQCFSQYLTAGLKAEGVSHNGARLRDKLTSFVVRPNLNDGEFRAALSAFGSVWLLATAMATLGYILASAARWPDMPPEDAADENTNHGHDD